MRSPTPPRPRRPALAAPGWRPRHWSWGRQTPRCEAEGGGALQGQPAPGSEARRGNASPSAALAHANVKQRWRTPLTRWPGRLPPPPRPSPRPGGGAGRGARTAARGRPRTGARTHQQSAPRVWGGEELGEGPSHARVHACMHACSASSRGCRDGNGMAAAELTHAAHARRRQGDGACRGCARAAPQRRVSSESWGGWGGVSRRDRSPGARWSRVPHLAGAPAPCRRASAAAPLQPVRVVARAAASLRA